MSKLPDPILKFRDPELIDWIDATNFVINTGRYQFPVVNQVPTEQSNSGEQRVYASDDGTLRRFYVYIGGQWNQINFDGFGNVTTSGFSDHIIDASGDTLVHTEFTANEDRIRHYSKGVYVVAIDTYALQIASGYKMVFNGLGGTTYWTYSSASTYMQCYVNGSLRMEM